VIVVNVVGRASTLIVGAALVVSGCSSGVSLFEYTETLETHVHDMNLRLDEAVIAEPSPSTTDGVRALWAERADARWDFVEAFGDLEPPDSVADLHDAALDLVTRLAEAESAISARVNEASTVAEMQALMSGPEAATFARLDAEAVAFCRAAQAQLDSSEAAEAFEGMPFIPTEMTEVIVVAFRCTAAERGLTP